jgi:monoamine oxidase
MSQVHDVVIVGAGPAGLATAYYLRDLGLNICVIEAGSDIGGRTESRDLAGEPVNTGAMFIYRGTRAESLAQELGLPTAAFRPTTYGIHIDGVTSVASTTREVVANLPIEPGAKASLEQFMDSIASEYSENVSGGTIAESAADMAHQTVAARLVGLAGPARSIIESAVRGGAVGSADQLSAKYALRYLASYIVHESNNRLYPLNGMHALPRALAAGLGSGTVISTGTRAGEVRQAGDLLEVLGANREGSISLLAKHVVLAVPAPKVGGLCPNLPDWKNRALEAAETPGSSTLAVAVNIEGLPEYADWSFVSTAGKKFDAIINPMPGVVPEDHIVRFTCYGNSAGYLPGFEQDRQRIDSWLDDFLDVAPALRGRIVGAVAATWENCFSVLSPRRHDALPYLQRSLGNLHFAGDYTSETAGSHGAYDEGYRVAAELRARYAEVREEAPVMGGS